MAENPLLPGTEMEVIEKYPLSRRLDHPNFGDVCKTTFAKGVISDFEKISDDPIMVKSRVKVTGDFGKSDYIPLFYHPKAEYWDGPLADPPVLATDFDEETGAFKQAWQSFRSGDEVAVMLKEGVPVAVMGFSDGVPRIGEDVVKLETQSLHTSWDFEDWEHPDYPSRIGANWPDAFVRMNKADFHDEGEKGPDGLDLKLLLEAERYDGPEEETVMGGTIPTPIDHGAPYGSFYYNEGIVSGYVGEFQVYIKYTEGGSTVLTKIALWLIKVGPIVYAIYGKYRESYSKYISYCVGDDNEPPVGTITHITHTYSITRLCVKAGIYKEGIEEEMIATLGAYPDWNYLGGLSAPNWWPVEVGGMNLQADLTALLSYLCAFDAKSFDEVQWFARPHTKAELQAASMWPAV